MKEQICYNCDKVVDPPQEENAEECYLCARCHDMIVEECSYDSRWWMDLEEESDEN